MAAITHGHPSGYLAAGVLASVIFLIRKGDGLKSAIDRSLEILKTKKGHEECETAILNALEKSRAGEPSPERLEELGQGWVAEEALAISLYCSLCHETDFSKGVLLAVNHSGDSDSTGAITGNILGLKLGKKGIPETWIRDLELKNVIEQIALDLYLPNQMDDLWWEKYPGY